MYVKLKKKNNMKKILMMVVAAMMATVTVNAQQMFLKPMVGGTLSTLTGQDDAKMKFGFVGGAEFGYQVADPFAVTVGALVSMQGAKMDDDKLIGLEDASTTLTYLNVPILANYYIIPGLAVKAGIQPGFLLFHKSKYTILGEKEENTSTDELKTFDLSIPLGLSYEFSDFVIDARYNLGLTKVNKDSKLLDKDMKNSVIMLTLGYKIPF